MRVRHSDQRRARSKNGSEDKEAGEVKGEEGGQRRREGDNKEWTWQTHTDGGEKKGVNQCQTSNAVDVTFITNHMSSHAPWRAEESLCEQHHRKINVDNKVCIVTATVIKMCPEVFIHCCHWCLSTHSIQMHVVCVSCDHL